MVTCEWSLANGDLRMVTCEWSLASGRSSAGRSSLAAGHLWTVVRGRLLAVTCVRSLACSRLRSVLRQTANFQSDYILRFTIVLPATSHPPVRPPAHRPDHPVHSHTHSQTWLQAIPCDPQARVLLAVWNDDNVFSGQKLSFIAAETILCCFHCCFHRCCCYCCRHACCHACFHCCCSCCNSARLIAIAAC